MSVSGQPPSPSGSAGDRADEALGRLAPARFVGQMPEAHERLGEKPYTRWRRAIMGLAWAGAGHIGGVARGEEKSARAVAEQIDGLARQPARGFEVVRLAARLE